MKWVSSRARTSESGADYPKTNAEPSNAEMPGPVGPASCNVSCSDSLDLIDSGWGRLGPEDPTDLIDGKDVWPL